MGENNSCTTLKGCGVKVKSMNFQTSCEYIPFYIMVGVVSTIILIITVALPVLEASSSSVAVAFAAEWLPWQLGVQLLAQDC